MSLSRCTAARGEVEADSAVSVARTRVYFVTPGDNDSEAARAAAACTGTAAEAAVRAAVETAADKRQVAVHNPIDSAADGVRTAEGVAVRNSEVGIVGNPADYTAPAAARIPAAVALAGVRWECDPRSLGNRSFPPCKSPCAFDRLDRCTSMIHVDYPLHRSPP